LSQGRITLSAKDIFLQAREVINLMSREEHEHAMSDDEFLQKLSDEYQEALLAEDRMRIENNIAPRFWQRFGRYFHAYSVEWKDPHPTTPVTRHLSESALGEVEMEWMEQVLRGDIELGDETDEEGW
jgi:hypothetical protein